MAIVLEPKTQKQAAMVPDGSYKAELTKVTQFSNTYGLRIGFEFTLHGTGVEGHTLMRFTNSELTFKSKLAEVLNGLLGRELTPGEVNSGYDVEQLVGKDCNVLVINARSKNGVVYSNVERVYQAIS